MEDKWKKRVKQAIYSRIELELLDMGCFCRNVGSY